ncbi:hypothetical protein COV19_06800 [Candidatus Woesearchaeota archaeon CG10_big_fil_rev_8_21_14_0_10_44_13]|nr:MAG: hypothetical protein COV19_06800 [Candidatus Woesearchaeota archaeon CG10_big_fil_rev_8_21_14_0_10_44_13]
MRGIPGNLALQIEEHRSFSAEDLGRIYPFIEPPSPDHRGPYSEPGMQPKPEIIRRLPVVFPNLALGYNDEFDVLVLENHDKKLSGIIDREIIQNIHSPPYKTINIRSVGTINSALISLLEGHYNIVSSVLETEESNQAGLEFSKLVKLIKTDDERIMRIQDRYKNVPVILCEPDLCELDDAVFAIFLKTKASNHSCHVFPYTDKNYTVAIKHFFGMDIDPRKVPYFMLREKNHMDV